MCADKLTKGFLAGLDYYTTICDELANTDLLEDNEKSRFASAGMRLAANAKNISDLIETSGMTPAQREATYAHILAMCRKCFEIGGQFIDTPAHSKKHGRATTAPGRLARMQKTAGRDALLAAILPSLVRQGLAGQKLKDALLAEMTRANLDSKFLKFTDRTLSNWVRRHAAGSKPPNLQKL